MYKLTVFVEDHKKTMILPQCLKIERGKPLGWIVPCILQKKQKPNRPPLGKITTPKRPPNNVGRF